MRRALSLALLSILVTWPANAAFTWALNRPFGFGIVQFNGICNVVSGGCAEAWGMSEALTTAYQGPLFQLSNGSSTLDIVQGPAHSAYMGAWPAFCGGSNSTSGGITTNSVCKVSKIYAEIQGHANDLVPSVFSAPFGPDCSAGGNTCACPFRYETASGLPILYKTTETCEYTLASDAAATGINSGTNPLSILYSGLPNTSHTQCCGTAGMTHVYNAGDTKGTDFSLVLAWGQAGGSGANCTTASTSCLGTDEELAGTVADYTPPSPGPLLAAIIHDTGANSTRGWLNGTQLWSVSPPASSPSTLNPGTSVHVGGGGDLSQPAMTALRELAITNSALSTADLGAAYTQTKANYAGGLTFGDI